MTQPSYPKWAVAALALFTRSAAPLIIKTFISSKEVRSHPHATTCANLFVGEEDIVRLHFLLFSSLDRCEDIVRERQQQINNNNNNSNISNNKLPPRLSPGEDVRFLGKLIKSHPFTSYGFQSASGIFTILINIGIAPVDAILPLCRAMYEAASICLCNPFHTPRMQANILRRWYIENTHNEIIENEEEKVKLEIIKEKEMIKERDELEDYSESIRAAPTPETMREEPALIYSRGFREQMRSIIGPFTVTARSSIVT